MADSALTAAIRACYQAGQDDERLEPLVVVDEQGQAVGRVGRGDYVIFYDIRGEREIELTQSFTQPGFAHFPTQPGLRVNFVTLTEYSPHLPVRVAFPPIGQLADTLSQVLASHGLRQAKITESEKAAHITFFLNGRDEQPVAGEERIILPSPKGLVSHEQRPEMSLPQVAGAVVDKIGDPGCDFIWANFANTDVVGHSENAPAIKQALAAVDRYTGQVVAAARDRGVTTIVTADHGTVEKWLYPEGTIDTGHTASPVPFILIPPTPPHPGLRERGELADIAPTVLHLLGLPLPPAMTGKSLLLDSSPARVGRILLLILDGWGIREESYGNLIAEAATPVMDRLQHSYPSARLEAAGEAVGLPPGAVGNSEVGHLHIGAGRRIYSDRARIDRAIEDGSFFENEALLWAVRGARREGVRLHLLGIVSFYSSHGSLDHLLALLRLAHREGVAEVYIHSLLGRRGERPESGASYIQQIEEAAARLRVGRVVSAIGRFWALDREENWDRVERAYQLLVWGQGQAVRGREPSQA